jgi:tmRNA-binding protein
VGDKRRALKDRDQKREIERALSEHARGGRGAG